MKDKLKVLGGISTVLLIILSLLQIYEKIDFISLIYSFLLYPIYFFLVLPIPIYGIILFVGIIFLVLYLWAKISPIPSITSQGRTILDNVRVRFVALSCLTPQTAKSLSEKLDAFERVMRYSTTIAIDDILRDLENSQYVEYDKTENK